MFGQLPLAATAALGDLSAELAENPVREIDTHLIELIEQLEHLSVEAFGCPQDAQLVPPPLLSLGGCHCRIAYWRTAYHLRDLS
jgi:hypothetical protein